MEGFFFFIIIIFLFIRRTNTKRSGASKILGENEGWSGRREKEGRE